MDQLTKYLKLAVDVLFLKQPTRSSLGLILGLSTRTVLKMIAAWSAIARTILDANISVWEYGLLGIALAHIPTAVGYFFYKPNYLSENEEKAFSMIRSLNIPDFQKQTMYLKIVEKVLERVDLKPELQNEINRQSN
jgi:hypothetical protein